MPHLALAVRACGALTGIGSQCQGQPDCWPDTPPMAGQSTAMWDTSSVPFWLDVEAGGRLVWPMKPSPAIESWAIATKVLAKTVGRAQGCAGLGAGRAQHGPVPRTPLRDLNCPFSNEKAFQE